jgi:hypothetical protein
MYWWGKLLVLLRNVCCNYDLVIVLSCDELPLLNRARLRNRLARLYPDCDILYFFPVHQLAPDTAHDPQIWNRKTRDYLYVYPVVERSEIK